MAITTLTSSDFDWWRDSAALSVVATVNNEKMIPANPTVVNMPTLHTNFTGGTRWLGAVKTSEFPVNPSTDVRVGIWNDTTTAGVYYGAFLASYITGNDLNTYYGLQCYMYQDGADRKFDLELIRVEAGSSETMKSVTITPPLNTGFYFDFRLVTFKGPDDSVYLYGYYSVDQKSNRADFDPTKAWNLALMAQDKTYRPVGVNTFSLDEGRIGFGSYIRSAFSAEGYISDFWGGRVLRTL